MSTNTDQVMRNNAGDSMVSTKTEFNFLCSECGRSLDVKSLTKIGKTRVEDSRFNRHSETYLDVVIYPHICQKPEPGQAYNNHKCPDCGSLFAFTHNIGIRWKCTLCGCMSVKKTD